MTRASHRSAVALTLTASLVAVLTTGCRSDEPPAPPGETFDPPSAYDMVLDQVGPEGEVSLETALAAFSLAIAPLPGVPEPPGPRDTIDSGTAAVRWTLGHWAELTPEQRAVVKDALTVTEPGNHGLVPVAYAVEPADENEEPYVACPPADSGDAAPLRPVLDQAIADVSARLGRSLSIPVRLVVHTRSMLPNTRMFTMACARGALADGKPDACALHVNPLALSNEYTDKDRRNFLVHEAMHCFHMERLAASYFDLPPWLAEGIPAFVQAAIGGHDPMVRGFWHQYLELDHKRLFARSYDALGFYVQVANSGVDLWQHLDPMTDAFLSSGNAAAWTASGLGDAFLRTWAPGHVRGDRDGADWDIVGYGIPAYWPPMKQFDALTAGATAEAAAPSAAVDVIRFVLPADVVVLVESEPAARGLLGLADLDLPLAGLGRAYLCTKPGGCACPDRSDQPRDVQAGPGYLGVTGGLSAAKVTLRLMTPEEFCQPPATACLIGDWVMTNTDLTADAAHMTGGAGARLTIAADGRTAIDYTPMQPVSAEIDGAGLSLVGELRYDGVVTAQLALPDPSATEAELVSTDVDVNGLTATFLVREPFEVLLFDRVPFAELAGQLGLGPEALPLYNRIPVTCTPTSLEMRPAPGSGFTGGWFWSRA